MGALSYDGAPPLKPEIEMNMKTIFKTMALAVAMLSITVGAQAQFIKTVSTLADLKLVQPDLNYPFCLVLGWTSAGDGGGGLYQVQESASATNYAIVTSSVNDSRQWVRSPGLQGFGKPPRTQTVTAPSTLAIEADTIAVAGTSGAVVLTNNQTLASGVDGQVLTIIGTSDTDTVQLVDKDTLSAGGTIQMSATNIVLGAGDVIMLKYNGATTNWHEVSRSLN